MGSAVDPYGGFVHSLSDPRDDSFGPRDDRPRKFYTPQIAIALPPPPCMTRFCSKPPNHLGACDHAELGAVDNLNHIQFNNPKEKTNMEYKSSGNNYIKWDAVGMTVRGRLLSYERKPNNLNNGKLQGEITLRTKDGLRIASCPAALDKIFQEHHAALGGKVIRITYTGTQTHKADGTKYMQPLKLFKVEDDDGGQQKAPPPPPAEDDGDEIPF